MAKPIFSPIHWTFNVHNIIYDALNIWNSIFTKLPKPSKFSLQVTAEYYFYVRLYSIKIPAFIEFNVSRLDSLKNSRKIRWKIVFVRQRQVQMSSSKILGTANSIYNFQMQFEKSDVCEHPLKKVGQTTVSVRLSFNILIFCPNSIVLLAIHFKLYRFCRKFEISDPDVSKLQVYVSELHCINRIWHEESDDPIGLNRYYIGHDEIVKQTL